MSGTETFDVVVVGGGPAGATAAADLARRGRQVLLLDRAGRIKPCGGAIPPRVMTEFGIPEGLLVARVTGARIISPKDRTIDMPIDDGGFVGMVDRDVFDEWLRNRAAALGAERRTGQFLQVEQEAAGTALVHYRPKETGRDGPTVTIRAKVVIGADGARSAVARQSIGGAEDLPHVFAYHEILRAPQAGSPGYDPTRCDVFYNGRFSPDFYSWIFPHGDTLSIGTGSAVKGFSLRGAIGDLRRDTGLDGAEMLRHEGAPIPLHPLPRWDNGRNVVLAGDAAGVVAPASGEGIYYAMLGGRLAADAAEEFCATTQVKALRSARRRFMRQHGQVFWMLGIMQKYWYSNDRRRERFVKICADRDVQQLTWDGYMNKELVKAKPLSHVRIFFKNIGHLTGLAPV